MSLPTHPISTLNIVNATSSSPPSTTASTRSVVVLPGLGNNSGDYRKLCCTLLDDYGIPSVVSKVSRLDWLRNAAGLLDSNYWRGTLRPRPVLNWYLERVEDAVCEAKALSPQGRSIALIGHSAGGWLARVYIETFGWSNISLLLTLGTPHLPPSKGTAGVVDQTRGLLDYVEKYCAPAVYTPELKYVCISGSVRGSRLLLEFELFCWFLLLLRVRYIRGARMTTTPESDVTNLNREKASESLEEKKEVGSTSAAPTLSARFIGQGYRQVCGRADVWGDGVVPEMAAHLDGALNVSLDGVYHSPVGSDDLLRPWYGSPSVVQKWVHHLLN